MCLHGVDILYRGIHLIKKSFDVGAIHALTWLRHFLCECSKRQKWRKVLYCDFPRCYADNSTDWESSGFKLFSQYLPSMASCILTWWMRTRGYRWDMTVSCSFIFFESRFERSSIVRGLTALLKSSDVLSSIWRLLAAFLTLLMLSELAALNNRVSEKSKTINSILLSVIDTPLKFRVFERNTILMYLLRILPVLI